jgi:hypothetical protein
MIKIGDYRLHLRLERSARHAKCGADESFFTIAHLVESGH